MKKSLLGIAMLFMMLAVASITRAQDNMLDDVDTSVEPNWVQIRIHFTMPINYVRHFPDERGQLLQIFFSIVGVNANNLNLMEEIRNVPATLVIPATTITFKPPLSLDIRRDPSTLLVRFDHPVNYDVRPGDDQRSIVIYIPVTPVEIKPAEPAKNKPEKMDNPSN